jgi:hypothetical protein
MGETHYSDRLHHAVLKMVSYGSATIKPDPQHPCLTKLRQALRERWTHFSELHRQDHPEFVERLKSGKPRVQDYTAMRAYFGESGRLEREIIELVNWAIPENVPVDTAQIVSASAGISAYLTVELMGSAMRSRRGRPLSPLARNAETRKGNPRTKRQAAIFAFEMHTADPKRWPWSKLAREYCDCGEPRHTFQCQERLRAEVRSLKRVLRKFAITCP